MLQVGLLNVDGYYDPLLMLFDKGAMEGFIKQDCRDIIVSAPTAHELLKKMEVKWPHLLIFFERTALDECFSIDIAKKQDYILGRYIQEKKAREQHRWVGIGPLNAVSLTLASLI